MTDKAAMLADLARVKVLFQARTIAAVIGAPAPVLDHCSGCGAPIAPAEVCERCSPGHLPFFASQGGSV